MKALMIVLLACFFSCTSSGQQKNETMSDVNQVTRTEEEWKEILTPAQYNICRLKGTEAPGSGKYDKFFEPGFYKCVACESRLFDSDTKYNSGSGWPAFFDMHDAKTLSFHEDRSLGMLRTEVNCANCGSHLGHVFDDGPKPTGLRYCINSLALEFVPVAGNDK